MVTVTAGIKKNDGKPPDPSPLRALMMTMVTMMTRMTTVTMMVSPASLLPSQLTLKYVGNQGAAEVVPASKSAKVPFGCSTTNC